MNKKIIKCKLNKIKMKRNSFNKYKKKMKKFKLLKFKLENEFITL